MKNKKVTGRIVAVLLIALGLVLGVTWTPTKDCIGDEIFAALGSADINIRTIIQGPDELNIIFGVMEEDFESAIKVLYNSFVTK